jgi:hypothetical protein
MTNPASADTRLGSNRRLASVLVFPAITVPAGFTPDGLPVGLEFMGKPFSDADLLSFAYAFEQATHHRRPPKVTLLSRWIHETCDELLKIMSLSRGSKSLRGSHHAGGDQWPEWTSG